MWSSLDLIIDTLFIILKTGHWQKSYWKKIVIIDGKTIVQIRFKLEVSAQEYEQAVRPLAPASISANPAPTPSTSAFLNTSAVGQATRRIT